MKIQGTNTVTLFNDFDETRKAITRKLHEDHAGEEYEKQLLSKAAKSFAIDDTVETEPKIEDYAYIQFRHLSKTIVGPNSYKASDFSQGNVLKNSTNMLNGVNAYTNHFAYVGNQIGKVLNPEWSNGYKNDKGEQVPPGINAPFVIDKVLHPKLVRELNSLVGSPIDSASVTVLFEWEASHEFERDYDFYYHLGETIDGSMVRRIAKEIKEYEESSLVWSGADPYAKILHKPGSIESEGFSRSNKFSKNPELALYDSGRRFYIFDSFDKSRVAKFNKQELSFNSIKKGDNQKQLNFSKMEEQYLKLVADLLGKKVEDLSEEDLKSFNVVKAEEFQTMKTNSESYEALKSEVDTLKSDKQKLTEEVTTLKKAKTDLESEAKVGKEMLEGARKKAVELYEKFAGDDVDDTIKEELEKADSIKALEAKAKLFGGKLYERFGAYCTSCKSNEHIELRSSIDDTETGGEKGEKLSLKPMHLAAREEL